MSDYRVHISITNEDESYTFSDFREDPEDWYADVFDQDGGIKAGALYRVPQAEYGRCLSSVYVDQPDGPPKRCGWFFVKRERYEDTGGPYLRGAWVTVERIVEPARPALVEAVAL